MRWIYGVGIIILAIGFAILHMMELTQYYNFFAAIVVSIWVFIYFIFKNLNQKYIGTRGVTITFMS